MYAYGDDDPRADAVATMEEILLDFSADLCRAAKACAVQAAPYTITASTKASVDPASMDEESLTAQAGRHAGASDSRQPAGGPTRRGGKDTPRARAAAGASAATSTTTQVPGGERLPYHHRRVKVDDFKFALRKDAKKLGRVEELMALQKEIADARKLFDEKQT